MQSFTLRSHVKLIYIFNKYKFLLFKNGLLSEASSVEVRMLPSFVYLRLRYFAVTLKLERYRVYINYLHNFTRE
jgi:hypothetical protein